MQENNIVQAPHVMGGEPVDYRIVIPTRGRWKEARLISPEKELKKERTPFILLKTLGFLKTQKIDPRRVSLWTADEAEKAHYQEVLEKDDYWAGGMVQIFVGVPGILHQRNYIVEKLPENTYIVSLDDDLANVYWKKDAGIRDPLVPLPGGSLEPLIFHAYALMKEYKAWIWGLSSTAQKNPRNMWMDGVSTRNGEINGFFYGFINRHDPSLRPQVSDATEDAERSLRYFQSDRILLRYRMYCGDTKCFAFEEGLQGLFDAPNLKEKWVQRKEAERLAADRLHEMFPSLTGVPKHKKGTSTLEINFRALGSIVLPTSTAAALRYANEAEKATGRCGSGKDKKSASSDSTEVCSSDAERKSPVKRRKPPTTSSDCRFPGPRGSMQSSQSASSSQLNRSDSDIDGRSPKTPFSQGIRSQFEETLPTGMIDIDSDEEDAGANENAEFERLFAGSSGPPNASSSAAQADRAAQEEAQMIRRAVEESLRDMILVINGTSSDPLADAIAESQKMHEGVEQNLRRKSSMECSVSSINGTSADPLADAIAESQKMHKHEVEKEQLAASLQTSELERGVSLSESEGIDSVNSTRLNTVDESPTLKRPRTGTPGATSELVHVISLSESEGIEGVNSTKLHTVDQSPTPKWPHTGMEGATSELVRVSLSESEGIERVNTTKLSSVDESPTPKRPRMGTEGEGEDSTVTADYGYLANAQDYGYLANLQRLVEMGFDRHDAQRALRDASGSLELAGAILVSGAAS